MRIKMIALLLAATAATPALAQPMTTEDLTARVTADANPVQLAMLQRGDRAERRRERRAERAENRNDRGEARVDHRQDRRADRRQDHRVERRVDHRQDRRTESRIDRRQDRRAESRYDRRQDRREVRRDYRRDQRNWNRSWRNDRRYDWQRYRQSNRRHYNIGRYYAPYRGYNYRRFSIGLNIGSAFFGSRYWINDPWQYRLPPAYGGYRWIRYYDDVLLVDTRTGYIEDVIYDFFY